MDVSLSDILLHFKTTACHRRLQSKIKASVKCRSEFYELSLGSNIWWYAARARPSGMLDCGYRKRTQAFEQNIKACWHASCSLKNTWVSLPTVIFIGWTLRDDCWLSTWSPWSFRCTKINLMPKKLKVNCWLVCTGHLYCTADNRPVITTNLWVHICAVF